MAISTIFSISATLNRVKLGLFILAAFPLINLKIGYEIFPETRIALLASLRKGDLEGKLQSTFYFDSAAVLSLALIFTSIYNRSK